MNVFSKIEFPGLHTGCWIRPDRRKRIITHSLFYFLRNCCDLIGWEHWHFIALWLEDRTSYRQSTARPQDFSSLCLLGRETLLHVISLHPETNYGSSPVKGQHPVHGVVGVAVFICMSTFSGLISAWKLNKNFAIICLILFLTYSFIYNYVSFQKDPSFNLISLFVKYRNLKMQKARRIQIKSVLLYLMISAASCHINRDKFRCEFSWLVLVCALTFT